MNALFTIQKQYGRQKERYLELIEQFPLKPIAFDKEHEEALEIIYELISKSKLTQAESDYLNVLSGLVEEYEEKTVPLGETTDAQMLKSLMEYRELTQIQFAKEPVSLYRL